MNLHSVFRLSSVMLLIGQPLFADIVKQNNTEYLNAGTSWVGGTAPTASDVTVWDSMVTSANSSALTNDATWDGIRIASPGGPVTINFVRQPAPAKALVIRMASSMFFLLVILAGSSRTRAVYLEN